MTMHILIVEDDVVNRRYLGELLMAWGHQFCLAGSLREARLAVQRHDFDLCLVDQRLPDGLGESLRSQVHSRLVMMSGDPPPDGADWLLKPIAAEALQRLLSGTPPAGPEACADANALDLDDAAAARTLGAGSAALAGLRRLLRNELARETPLLRAELAGAEHTAAVARLHRWRAASALCGAERLKQTCAALERALRTGADASDARTALDAAVASLLPLLEGGTRA